ncbi:MAG: fatty acid desaturase, partial [Roseibium aggregatum]
WNMNYHVEHHMFPLVPYFRLPELHEEIAFDLPKPCRSIAEGFREMWPALLRQRTHPDFHIRRPLPGSAAPYQDHPPATVSAA